MTLDEEVKINNGVIDILCKLLYEITEDDISLDSCLMNDLGADSLDLIVIEMALHEEFKLNDYCFSDSILDYSCTVRQLIDYVVTQRKEIEYGRNKQT